MATISSNKRRFINQLPQVHQTGVLKNFFAATIDNLFQRGSSESLSGYIGQKPSYFDPTKDFYVPNTRSGYQLEPAMVSTDESGEIVKSLCYDDLINYLRSQGSIVDNHSRLFETDYYSWSPPIDLDKINNPSQYVWMGGLTPDEYRVSGMVLRAPRNRVGYAGNSDIALPSAIPSLGGRFESPVVLVNGKKVRATFSNGIATILDPVAAGAQVETIRYGDLRLVIEGKEHFDLSPFMQWANEANGFDANLTYRTNMDRVYKVGEVVYHDGEAWRCTTEHTAGLEFDTTYWTNVTGAEKATTGRIVMLEDGVGTTLAYDPKWAKEVDYLRGDRVVHDGSLYIALLDHNSADLFDADNWLEAGAVAARYIIDGVGTSIELSDDYSTQDGGRAAHYLVIDRRSVERSPWAKRNMWVHKDTLDWTGVDFRERRAVRPIVEFLPSIELFNYGWNRLPDVQATLSTERAKIRDNWDMYPWNVMPWESEEIPLSRINGQPIGYRSYYRKDANGNHIPDPTNQNRPQKERKGPFGCVEVDAFTPNVSWVSGTVIPLGGRIIVGNYFYVATEEHIATNIAADMEAGRWEKIDGYLIKPNDRLLVRQQSTLEPELNNLIYRVVANDSVELPNGGEADVLELVAENAPMRGDIVRVVRGDAGDSVFYEADEYWFDGENWLPAQIAIGAPLFMLFDADKNRLSDEFTYQRTDFAGSRLFGYAAATGKADNVLGFPVRYNAYAQPVFEVDSVTRRVNFEGGEIGGYYFHRFVDNDTYSNNWFSVAHPTRQEVVNDVYEIPLNLQANPNNEEVTFISRNEWFDQFSGIMLRQEGFEGHPYADNNWRDTPRTLGNGDKILQHRAPLLRTMLLASEPSFDVLSAIRFMETEYVRYRNKLSQRLLDFQREGAISANDPVEVWVQHTLESLRLNKTADFPFASSRVAGGQYFIPPSAAFLGVIAPVRPKLTSEFLTCHDGAEVPVFGDFRDSIMLAFEERVYQSIPEEFRTEARPVFDLDTYVEGHWYTSENAYTRAEFNQILSPMFERWVQLNGLDYRTNSTFDANNPFTWNYSTCTDETGNLVEGSVGAIYHRHYDTDRPHLEPWAMVGFREKPYWWDTEYGPAPYTSGNVKLWEDMRDGRVRGGVREGIDPRYARPTLLDKLPVDANGNIVDPEVLGVIMNKPVYQDASANWKFGDGGPIEMLWRKSPSFPFALARAAYLMKPARFIEQCWDTLSIVKDASGQWIYLPTGNRPSNSNITIHGETMLDGSRHYASGVQQWISDHMVSKGQTPELLGSAVRGLNARLAHKVGGFTSEDALTVMADNFGEVPSEDINISLYQSPSIREEVYSGVLIEALERGWRVIGYDSRNPEFKVIYGEENGPSGVITLAEQIEKPHVQWSPNTHYLTNTRVAYNSIYYEALRPHVSGEKFEGGYWKMLGSVPPAAPRVIVKRKSSGIVTTVPYGTVFASHQEVADFLLGHEAYMQSRGWVFDNTERDETSSPTWASAVREFLGWSQVNWEVGSFITMSPSASGALFRTEHGMVLDILSPINGAYGMVNRTGYPVDRRDVVVNRIDGEAAIYTKNGDLYGARVHVGEIEHVMFFSNTTIFGDIIYSPLFNLRQPRLRLIGHRSKDWTGRLDAAGYMLIDGKLVSNFEKSADDLLTMFDIEGADNALLRDHARHVVGYDSRDYFQSLVLSETQQFEFYQGMIQQKGAPGAFNKLMRSDYIEQDRDIRFFEEWAIKLDEYGAVAGRSRASFLLGTSSMRNDPQMIQFRNTGSPTRDAQWHELIDNGIDLDSKWIERPKNPMVTFPSHSGFGAVEGGLPMSGYVRKHEVNDIVWDEDSMDRLYTEGKVLPRNRVWVHHMNSVNEVFLTANWGLVAPNQDLATNIAQGWVNEDGDLPDVNSYLINGYFESRKCEATIVTSREIVNASRIPHELRYTFTKTSDATNGKDSYIKIDIEAEDNDGDTVLMDFTVEAEGYNLTHKIIDTSSWVVGEEYDVVVKFTPTVRATRIRDRVWMNRGILTPPSFQSPEYSNATFMFTSPVTSTIDPHDWQVFQFHHASVDGKLNKVREIITPNENPMMDPMVTRFVMERPHGIPSQFLGKRIFVMGQTATSEEMEGAQIIQGLGENWIEFLVSNNHGVDFANADHSAPHLILPRPVRFKDAQAMEDYQMVKGVKDGDLVYLDGADDNTPWRVLARRRTQLGLVWWEPVRRQPERINAKTITSALVYDLKTKITHDSISPEPLAVDYLNVIAPANGIIIGRAEREIEWKLKYDPANYSDHGWGKPQVGRVWWDLSTVRFLETETDSVVFGQSNLARYEDEANYRAANWGKIAPASSVDIYEWVRSTLTPHEFMVAKLKDKQGVYVGVPKGYKGINAEEVQSTASLEADIPYITRVEFNRSLGRDEMVYYYWMTDLPKVPEVPFRKLDVSSVARIIANPTAQNAEWMSPIMPNAMVVGGVTRALDDNFDYGLTNVKRSGTVVQVELDEDPNNDGVIHEEWLLLRPNDERSLPPEWLWEKMRDSLVGFDDQLRQIPAPAEIVIGEPPATNGPVFETPPYVLDGDENTPYYPNLNVDNSDD